MQKVKLNEVKGFFKTEKIYKVENFYSYPCFGIGMPDIIFSLPMYWNVNSKGELVSPIKFSENKGIRKTFENNFGGKDKVDKVEVIFGNFWNIKTKSVFRIKEADNCSHVMLKVHCKCVFDPDRKDVLKVCNFYRLTRTVKNYCIEYFVFPISFLKISKEDLKKIAINKRKKQIRKERKYYDKINE